MARVPQKSTRAWDRSSRPGPPTIGEGVSRPTHRCRLRSPLTIRQGYSAMSGQTRARISALTKSRAPQLALVHSPVLVPANKTLAAAARRARHSSSVIARAARRRQIGQGRDSKERYVRLRAPLFWGASATQKPDCSWQSRAMATADTPAAATRSMAVRALGAFAFQASTSCREMKRIIPKPTVRPAKPTARR